VNELEYHPVCEIFPFISDEELNLLADDIKRNGLLNPIILLDGKILDGRNRYIACLRAGVEPVTRDYEGDDPARFAISQNVRRRMMTVSQKALVAAKFTNLEWGQRADLMIKSKTGKFAPRTQGVVAKWFTVSPRIIKDCNRIIRDHPDMCHDIEIGKKTVHEVMKEIQKGKRKPLAGVKLKNNDDDNFDSSDFVNTVNPKTALDFATCAVNYLEKIPYDDPSRKSCLELVAVWINENM